MKTDKRIRTNVVLPAVPMDGTVGGQRWYVSGENLPGAASDREASTGATDETALVPVYDVTIEEMLEAFKAWMRLDVGDGKASPHTLRAYFSDVRMHLEWLAARGMMPAEAGEEDLKAYRADLVERYAVTTVGRKLASIRRFYGMAMARGKIGQNPVEGLKAPRNLTDVAERVKYLPREVVRQVLAAPDTNKPRGIRDRMMMVLMAIHMMRVVEVHRLDLEDVDLEAGEAGTLHVLGKGNKERTIPLTEQTREVLRMWLRVRELMRSDSRALFLTMHWANGVSEPGQRISTRGIRAQVNRYLRIVGAKRPGISCHSLRHSGATHALDAGASLIAISENLGHAGVNTTQVYTKIVNKYRNNPAKWLEDWLE
jgi:site-specific recombinase XerD